MAYIVTQRDETDSLIETSVQMYFTDAAILASAWNRRTGNTVIIRELASLVEVARYDGNTFREAIREVSRTDRRAATGRSFVRQFRRGW